MVNKKSVLLAGYFGFNNFGDEAIFSVLKQHFSNDDLNVCALVRCPEKAKNEFNRHSLVEVLKAIRFCDIVVNGGGGLLQDKTSIRSLFYYLGILFIAKLFGKKTTCFAQGIGPIKRKISCLFTRFILNRADLITVRDEFSKRVLKNCGVSNKIHITADVGFLFDEENAVHLPYDRFILYAPGAAIHMPEIETLVKAGEFMREQTGLPLLLVPFYPERDGRVINELSKALNSEIFVPNRLGEYIYIIEKSGFVVGMRYHSIVFSILEKKAFVGLSYDPKVSAIMDEVGVKGIKDYGQFSVDEFKDLFLFNFSHRKEIEERLYLKREELIKRAQENFILFKETFLS